MNRPGPRPRRRPWRWAAAGLVAIALATGSAAAYFRSQPARELRALFGPLTATPARPLPTRFTVAAADQYRPHRPGLRPAEAPLSPGALARLDSRGQGHAIAVAFALAGADDEARRRLERLPDAPEVASDRAALLLADPAAAAEALEHLDRGLAARPSLPQALWNRAIGLRMLGLPLGAARSFQAVAALAEPGWAAEARRAASEATAAMDALRTRWRRVQEARDRFLDEGRIPPAEVIAEMPDPFRSAFYQALHRARSSQALRALAPLAAALDRGAGTQALGTQLDEALRSDFRRRATAVEAYLPLGPRSGAAEVETAAAAARAAHAQDLLAGALSWARSSAQARTLRELGRRWDDRWLQLLAAEREALAEAEANHVSEADAILRQARRSCASEPGQRYRCVTLSLARVELHGPRHQLQPALEAAQEAYREARAGGFLPELAHAVSRLAILESFRDSHAAAVAHAEEVVLLGAPCKVVQEAREFLAETALERREFTRARGLIASVVRCPDRPARFGPAALGVLAELARDARDPGGDQPLRWLDEAIEDLRRAGRLGTGALASMMQGQALVERDPPRARALFRRALKEAASAPPGSVRDEKARSHAYLGLVAEAGGRGAHGEALEVILEMEGLPPRPSGCLVAVARHFVRTLILVRGADGRLRGRFEPREPALGQADPRLPPELLVPLRGCREIAVVATAPVFGAAHLLPPELPWAYVTAARGENEPLPGRRRRLVVSAPDQPAELHLPVLRRVRAVAVAGEEIVELHGPQATPRTLLERMADADTIELHVHGIIDPRISDAAALVLSPPAQGAGGASPFLTAAEIQRTRLHRRPVVLLGACQAARSARYGPLAWSLPSAFLRAGASLVIASPSPVFDADAGTFFDRLRSRIADGEAPAVALRDARVYALSHQPQHWSRDLVLFD